MSSNLGRAPAGAKCRGPHTAEVRATLAFRRVYPKGENIVVAQDVDRAFRRNYGEISVRFESLSSFVSRIMSPSPSKTTKG